MLGYSDAEQWLLTHANAYPCYKEVVKFDHTYVKEWDHVATFSIYLKKCNNLGGCDDKILCRCKRNV